MGRFRLGTFLGFDMTVRPWIAVVPGAMAVLAGLPGGLGAAAAVPQGRPIEARESIRERLEQALVGRADEAGPRPSAMAGGTELRLPEAVIRFYEHREFDPAWTRADRIGREAHEFMAALRAARRDGLRPEDYHLSAVEGLVASLRRRGDEAAADPLDIADLDLLLTDGFLTYAGHLVSGRLDPATLAPRAPRDTEDVDPVELLAAALAGRGIGDALRGLREDVEAGYVELRDALAAYRRIADAGGWPPLPAGKTLRRGDEGPATAALRERLVLSGDHPDADPGGPVKDVGFDEELERAVRRFQRRHGLNPDGVVGPATRTALDVPAEARARQIEVNLERWRWLPRRLGDRYLLVNTAAFTARLVESGRPAVDLRVAVGSRDKPTPTFSDTIRYLVLNPSWNVPREIAREEILPMALADPEYLERGGYRILGPEGEIDPATLDPAILHPARFPYRLQQAPGPRNALGRVKFMFPNPHAVYLHDTPERHLFDRTRRDFSHGCIRIERAVELATRLLADRWTPERARTALGSHLETTVVLPDPLPIHILYWTAWVDGEDGVSFRDDIYGRDGQLGRALAGEWPGARSHLDAPLGELAFQVAPVGPHGLLRLGTAHSTTCSAAG